MRHCGIALLLVAPALWAQDGQQGPRPEWPCVAGRAVDPSYLETSESTGGQLFLFQKSEIGKAGPFLSASYTHPATVARAVGGLSAKRDLAFPVDSTITSMLVMASLQCRTAIRVFRPNGAEMTAANSAQSVDLQAGRIVQIDNPDPGTWKLQLEGTGLFVVSVQAKSPVQLRGVSFAGLDEPPSAYRKQPRLGAPDLAQIHFVGDVSTPKFRLVGPEGDPVADAEVADPQIGQDSYPVRFQSPIERFRIQMSATDASGWPVQRTYPVLFRAAPLK